METGKRLSVKTRTQRNSKRHISDISSYWKKFYQSADYLLQSSFAEYCLPMIRGTVVDLGCGNGRDLDYFLAQNIKAVGVDNAFSGEFIVNESVDEFIAHNPSPENVYARFFWHSIPRQTQLNILRWASDYIFIEARTTDDKDKKKAHGEHYRNYVDVAQLRVDLFNNNFIVVKQVEGTGLSKYGNEDPHLIRIIALKV